MKYIPALDGIRGVAVIFVIIYHWFPNDIAKFLSLGNVGVDAFFVLSGFLITRILLYARDNCEDDGKSRFLEIKKFFIRRSLRIFPLYYLVIFLLIAIYPLYYSPVKDQWPYFVLYLQNFLFFNSDSFIGGKVGHLWTLAVEEQFYLVWPWIILFINRKYLPFVFLSGMVLGTFFSVLFVDFLFVGKPTVLVHSLTCIQTFCIGGGLAFLMNSSLISDRTWKMFQFLAIASIVVYLFARIFDVNIFSLNRTLVSLLVVYLIYLLVNNKAGIFNRVFENEILMFVGKISYGIYVFHNFIPTFVKAIFHVGEKKYPDLALVSSDGAVLFYVVCFSILFLISIVSYYLFEMPFLKLKRRFV